MKKIFVVLMLVAVGATAQTVVKANQGAPGNQGPWPVTCDNCSGGGGSDAGTTVIVNVFLDGGFIGSTSTQPCRALIQTNDAGVGVTAQVVPATPATGRIWVQITNSCLNSQSTQCICSSSACPSFAPGSFGDVLLTCDSATYNIGVADGGLPCCICNGAGSFLPSTECVL